MRLLPRLLLLFLLAFPAAVLLRGGPGGEGRGAGLDTTAASPRPILEGPKPSVRGPQARASLASPPALAAGRPCLASALTCL